MFLVDTLLFVTGILLLLGIASSKFSARIGVPVLVLFLGLGMVAGSEGIGGIEFEDYSLAHGIGTVALALILFDGGLSTPFSAIRAVWKPSLSLATVGVLVTSVVSGWAASEILNIRLLEGMLLGSIVGSTDAAAVFGVLRSGGVHLPPRISSTLEIESGSNDPMAIFMTVGLIEVLLGRVEFGPGLLILFANQMIAGSIVGIAVGYAAVWLVNRISLDAAGLYPIFITACGLLAFGLAAVLGGSGFLAVYLAGIYIGNNRIVFQRGIFLFHDAAAWLSQIVMFVVLGLLTFPSRLASIAWQGLLVAVVLVLIARPLAVVLSLFLFRFNWRELTFISWVGLKGAVPITLATFPLLLGVEGAPLLFDVVFFVVLVSAAIQGWTLPFVAKWLRLQVPSVPPPAVTLEISSLRHVDGDIVDYTVGKDSSAAGRLVKELALPEGVVIAIIARQQQIIPPQGNTRIIEGDHVIIVMSPGARPMVDKVFGAAAVRLEELPSMLEFPLRPTTTVGELQEFYDIQMDAPPESTLDDLIRSRLGPNELRVGSMVQFAQIALHVRGLTAYKTVDRVGMVILPQPEPAPVEVVEKSSGSSPRDGIV